MQTQESSQAIIDQFRESHHSIARMIAAGMPDHMIMRRTGYTRRRITNLRKSPAFNQLIRDYQGVVFEKINEDTDSFAELAIGNMLAAERHISDRIADFDDRGELLPLRDALAISGDRADRFGYSKRVTQTNINVNMADMMDRAIERSNKAKQVSGPVVIEGRVESTQPHASPVSLVPPQEPLRPSTERAPGPSLSSALTRQYVRR